MMHVNGKPVKFLDDIWSVLVSSVVNGTIDYWADDVQAYKDEVRISVPDNGATVKTNVILRADLDKHFREFWGFAVAAWDFHYGMYRWFTSVLESFVSADAGEWDDEVVDVFIQFVVFGEIVYG